MPYLLHQLLTESARRDPQATAVVYQDRSITYGDLDAASGRLAGVLAAAGVSRGDRVGFYLNKSIESVIAIFGILKAGAVYVPLDPGAPVKRIGFIVGNSGVGPDGAIIYVVVADDVVAVTDPDWDWN